MSADGSSSSSLADDRLCPKIGKLTEAHAAVAQAIGRMVRAVSAGRETLIGIERLRLQNAADQYRTWATELALALDASGEDAAELRLRLSELQSAFRSDLEGKAAELARASRPPQPRPRPVPPIR